MATIGVFCPELLGHVVPTLTLSRELERRGHRIIFFGKLDVESNVREAGFGFYAIGESEFPVGSMADVFSRLGELDGDAAGRFTADFMLQSSAVILREGESVVASSGVDLLLVDQCSTAAGSVADALGIPFVSTCAALLLNEEPGIPPPYTQWRWSSSQKVKARNLAGYAKRRQLQQPFLELIGDYRNRRRLPLHGADNYFSSLAQISQQPPEFEFPRCELPEWFHFTGPFHNLGDRPDVSFPYHRLTGAPIVYASMGTLQNRQRSIFQAIAEACQDDACQLVISLGGAATGFEKQLPGNPLVVSYAPQLELLQLADLTITHGGLNTTLESLAAGVPIVTIPVTNDQPGVSARVAWVGAGVVLSLARVNPNRIRSAIRQVLSHERYRKNAKRMQEAIINANGLQQACDVIEQVIATDAPVMRDRIGVQDRLHTR